MRLLPIALALILTACTAGVQSPLQQVSANLPKSVHSDCAVSGKPIVDLRITRVPERCPLQRPFSKYINIFGIDILATASISDAKLLHAGNVLAQYLDNDADGVPDDANVLEVLHGERATLVMASEAEFEEFTEGELPEDMNFQDLLADETRPEFHRGVYGEGRFDATLEEVLHLVQGVGWANAYPEVFGAEPGSRLAEAMDVARGGHFEDIPSRYPASAWYTYNDETCDYG